MEIKKYNILNYVLLIIMQFFSICLKLFYYAIEQQLQELY